MNRAAMDRFIDAIEWIAAGFVGIVALNIFVSVILRNTLNYAIPDSFDIGRMLLGILIFWGIAATSYRGGHITVDLVWANVGPKYQRWIDVFATLVLLFVVSVQTWTLFDKVRGTYNDNVLTFDMHMPTWPFFAVAWAGDVSAVLLIAIRTYRLIFYPDLMHDSKIKAESSHEVYKLTPEQIGLWKKASEPLTKTWGEGVKKTGGDPDAALAELRAALKKYNALAE